MARHFYFGTAVVDQLCCWNDILLDLRRHVIASALGTGTKKLEFLKIRHVKYGI